MRRKLEEERNKWRRSKPKSLKRIADEQELIAFRVQSARDLTEQRIRARAAIQMARSRNLIVLVSATVGSSIHTRCLVEAARAAGRTIVFVQDGESAPPWPAGQDAAWLGEEEGRSIRARSWEDGHLLDGIVSLVMGELDWEEQDAGQKCQEDAERANGTPGFEENEAYSDEEDEEVPPKPSEVPLAISPQPVVELFKEMLINEWEENNCGGAIFKACLLTIKKLVAE